MSWLQRLFGEEQSKNTTQENHAWGGYERMKPGLTGEYDIDLREKAGMHQPPPPPECMGLEGEYDSNGLAKRVAAALDQATDVDDIETLYVTQEGSTVVFKGTVPDTSTLSYVTNVAAKVDGTKAVDTNQVTIKAG